MKRILLIGKNENKSLEVKNRKASRAIMIKDGLLVMIRSKKYGEYKFPGGGKKENEFLKETLKREVLEETGFDVIASSIVEFGKVEEVHPDSYEKDKIFKNLSYYYLCDFIDNGKNKNMDDYEIEYGYEVVFVDIDTAISENEKVIFKGPTWVKREIHVLKYIKDNYTIGNNSLIKRG